ncbi:MAG: hypothetical protein KKE44_06955 [Proteobacteria bacterium]|nr:hypothetical protein [Pseudomonadota bacterium]MBU1582468.1 hypothetical protein [Pseudomonadota bacterium]MBU2627591.1 hypothetical protein [Pseudomonadota bacterium]
MGIITENQNEGESIEYYSAEFQLNKSNIFFQFKLRKSLSEPMYAVVKEGSKALENIKEGDIVNMRYYYLDKSMPAELKDTKIKYITKDSSTGFKDHYVIGLDIRQEKELIVA